LLCAVIPAGEERQTSKTQSDAVSSISADFIAQAGDLQQRNPVSQAMTERQHFRSASNDFGEPKYIFASPLLTARRLRCLLGETPKTLSTDTEVSVVKPAMPSAALSRYG
jgi:hypothetical protein